MPADDPAASAAFRFRPPRTVEAGWLSCRRVQRDDTEDLLAAVRASADHLRPWMPWAQDYDRAKAGEFTARNAPAAGDDYDQPVADAPYVVRDRAGRFLGLAGLHARLGPAALEIGYWVDVRHTRRGVATLAAALLTETALALPSVGSVEIRHDQANVASGGVPARLGYTRVATEADTPEAPGEVGVDCRWAMRREEFPGSPASRLLAEARSAARG
jgi:ribosomal-protein-serine acetyltransferase